MSDFRKIGPAVVDADRVRMVRPTDDSDFHSGVWVIYDTDKEDLVRIESTNPEVTTTDLIRGAINEFYRPYNPPGAVTYEPREAHPEESGNEK